MAEIGGMLAASALQLAAGKVAEAAGDRFMLQWRFGDDMEAMRETMESIGAVLENAERQSLTDKTVLLWLDRLTGAAYDISDMFDEFEVNATRKSALRKLKILNPCLTLSSEVPMAGKMKRIRERLENIANERQRYSLPISNSSNHQQVINDRATSSEVVKEEILGRDEEKRKIMTLLTSVSSSSEFNILPIYGIGGIGKTTLAQLLFNDTYFEDYEKAWVYVSQTFDLNKIKEAIKSQLHLEQGQLANAHEHDAGPSARKSILIVLDDLWEENDFKLDNLKNSLKMIGNGHKVHILVTTRDAGIAQKIQTQTIEAQKINALPREVCWTIIKRIVGFEDRSDKERLKDIGKEIAAKCGGVALAARAVGYMLRSMDVDGWVSVKDNAIWNVSTLGKSSPYDNVRASLKLSYSSMPPYLRICFAYCAVFPKGHKMAKDELIYQWAALGFIKPSDRVSIRQHGEICINQLIGMSFLQHSKSAWSRKEYVNFFTMHDLVHDLARSVMGDKLHDASKDFKQFRERNCRYAFLADCSKPLNSYVTYPAKIRTARFLGSGETGHCSIVFSIAKYIKVLDLGESSLEKLPSSIGQLKLLRYLNAPGIKCRTIPSCITKLSKLMYLSLRGSSELLALPESIGGMEGLMYLDLSGCEGIKKLPESFGKLGSLIHLDLSFCPTAKGIAGALSGLTKLQYLNLSRTEVVTQGLHKVIDKLIELRYLCLSCCLDVLPVGMTIIDIFDSMSTLQNLEHLDLSDNERVESIPESICHLKRLHILDLNGCFHLQELPGNMGSMENLKVLIVDGCSNLDMSTMPINKNLVPLPNFPVHVDEGEQSSNLIMLKDVSPPWLTISRLENVKCLEEAQRIDLRGKQSLVQLTLDWTTGTKGFVEEKELLGELMPPSSLNEFDLRGYNSVSFPAWLTSISIYLPNLHTVTLENLSRCSSLPPLGQLPNLESLCLAAMPSITEIDIGLCGHGMKAFPRLEYLTICDLENLEEWSTTYSCGEGTADEFMFPNLKYLSMFRCPKLRVGPCSPRVHKTWHISESDSVLTRWEESAPQTASSTSSVSYVHHLWVESCMAPMREWKLIHHLSALHSLSIDECNDLINSSPEVTRALTPLQELQVSCCEGIQELPEWLRDLTALQRLKLSCCESIQELPHWLGDLVSLKALEIFDCKGITSFPESIKQLTNLEELQVCLCPKLTKWCELAENKTRIDHIKEVIIRQGYP